MTQDSISAADALQRLLSIMAALRTPVTGCPWDLEQTFATIAPYTIEEAYEVADAIERRDLADLKDELGDLLLQVVYHSRMAEEQGAFAFADVAEAVNAKMIRRHPHVFGTPEQRAAGAEPDFWAKMKAAEKAAKEQERARFSAASATSNDAANTSRILADVPAALPALTRAIKLQDKAARVGFDWPSLGPVFDKLKEELAEFEEVALPADPRGSTAASGRLPASQPKAVSENATEAHLIESPDGSTANAASGRLPAGESEAAIKESAIKEEFGDLLFVMANIARHLKLDPEAALRAANAKFTRRFAYIEARLAERGKTPDQSTLAEMDALWDEIRARDKQ